MSTEIPAPTRTAPPSPRTEVKRAAARGRYDAATIESILDAGFLCHVALHDGHQTVCIPTVYGRIGDAIYLHGAQGNRMLRALRDGTEACISVTHVDGLVLARSAFHHSVNYRSVVLFAKASEVTDPAEKQTVFEAIVEHAIPNRAKEVRAPNEYESKRTLVLRIPIDEASAKVRTGPPLDDESDLEIGCWAGVIPLAVVAGTPIDAPDLAAGIEAPRYVTEYGRPARR